MTKEPSMWSDAAPEDSEAVALFRRDGDAARRSSCPPPELVQASRVGVLSAPLQQQVATHVEGCVVCRALADALDDPSMGELTAEEHARIRQRVRSSAKPTFSTSRWPTWWPAVAAAAAIGGVTVSFSLLSQFRTVPPAQIITRAARDINLPNERSAFVLDKAPIRSQGADDLLWRGSAAGDEGKALAVALEPYRADDFAVAAARLARFVERYPQNATGHYHLGVSQLFLNRDAEAVLALERAAQLTKNDPDLTSDVAWYLGYAYQRVGQRDQAMRVLEPLCRSTDPRASQACSALTELSRRAR